MQVAVDVEAGVVFPAGNDEPLVGRVALIDDGVAEIALFGFEGDAVGVGEGGGEDGQDDQRAQADGAVTGQFGFEDACGQVGDGGVEDAEQEGGTRHAEFGGEQEREEQGNGECAQVVEGQDFGNELFKFRTFLV